MSADFKILEATLYSYELVLLVLAVAIFSTYRRQSPDFRWLALFVGASLLTDITSMAFYFWAHINTNYPSTIYDLVATPLLSLFFYFAIGSPKLRVPLVIVNVIFFILAVLNALFVQGTENINSYAGIMTAIVVLVLSIIFFYRLLQQLPTQHIQRLPLFWVISGLFLSYSGKLVVYSVQHYMVHILGDRLIIVQTFHNILSLICYGLILVGVIVKARNKNAPPLTSSR